MTEHETKIAAMTDITPFDEETVRLEMDCDEALALAHELVRQNAKTAQDQEQYTREYDALVARSNAAKAKLEAIKHEKQQRITDKEKLRHFLDILKGVKKPLTAFNEQLWQGLAETMIVRSLEDISVVFKSSTDIPVALDIRP